MEIYKYDINIRTVEIEDAEFILSLRMDEYLGRHLSPTDNDIEKQREWIKNYKQREELEQEFYFLTLGTNNEKLGVNRIYDFKDNSFESGSWLFKKDSTTSFSILSDLIGREYGFENLGFKTCRFNVQKLNTNVVNYNKLFKPVIVNENKDTIWFELSYENFTIQKKRFLRMFGK